MEIFRFFIRITTILYLIVTNLLAHDLWIILDRSFFREGEKVGIKIENVKNQKFNKEG